MHAARRAARDAAERAARVGFGGGKVAAHAVPRLSFLTTGAIRVSFHRVERKQPPRHDPEVQTDPSFVAFVRHRVVRARGPVEDANLPDARAYGSEVLRAGLGLDVQGVETPFVQRRAR